MMFRQLFDQTSGTYSYLLASRAGGEALIIDPVLEKCNSKSTRMGLIGGIDSLGKYCARTAYSL